VKKILNKIDLKKQYYILIYFNPDKRSTDQRLKRIFKDGSYTAQTYQGRVGKY
jgi:hypothetical protein